MNAKLLKRDWYPGPTVEDHRCVLHFEGMPPITAWGKLALKAKFLMKGDSYRIFARIVENSP